VSDAGILNIGMVRNIKNIFLYNEDVSYPPSGRPMFTFIFLFDGDCGWGYASGISLMCYIIAYMKNFSALKLQTWQWCETLRLYLIFHTIHFSLQCNLLLSPLLLTRCFGRTRPPSGVSNSLELLHCMVCPTYHITFECDILLTDLRS
jgi:hypothetical protein